MSSEREHALLDAALEVLGAVGYDKLTVASVCELAGASTKTAYRRWSNKDELLTAALQRAVERKVHEVLPIDMTNGLRAALITTLQAQADSYRSSANLVIGLIVASRVDGDLGAIARRVIRDLDTRRTAAILNAGVAHGEARADVDPEFVADLARSFFLHEVIVRDESPPPARIARFVDEVLLPACIAPRDR
jgi:AcrR family transcriptional regulator